MIQRVHSGVAPREHDRTTSRDAVELARCAAQLLVWMSEGEGRMLAEAVLTALDAVRLRSND